MTMINPCHNLSKQNLQSSVYVYGFGDYESNFSLMTQLAEDEGYDNSCLGSDLALIEEPHQNSSMAEDYSRTGSINETGSSSNEEKAKNKADENKEWLQLSIGGHTYMPTESSGRSGGLVELDLLSGKSILANSPTVRIHEFRPPQPRQPLMTTTSQREGTSSMILPQQHHQEIINWGFRPVQPTIQQNINLSLLSAGLHFGPGLLGGPGPSSIDFRVIHPPRRTHSGLWFSLQPSSNQTKEPFLPQISKSYLRIKNERMTIRLVLKYLVNKLQLENESEIEITCRGQHLQPFLTLQHVRDHIWRNITNAADNILTLLPSQTPSNHVMVLHYGRTN